ncbi:MAG: rRNA adenine N-6-methyltransferase family protein [Pyrinomonadaceae bacterium]
MSEKRQFLRALLRNPLGVGAITPSSRDLARMMIADVKPTPDEIILELGVGTGAITAEIQQILVEPNSYLGIEIDGSLVEMVKAKFPDLNIVNADACSACDLHSSLELGKVRYIVSGIPFVSLPKNICEEILGNIGEFMEFGCMFRTFQYVHGYYTPPAMRMREYMNKRFGPMKKSPVVLKNIPPAVTLTWSTV